MPCDSRPKCLRRLQIHLLTYLLTYFDVYAHEMAPLLTSALQLLTGSYGQLWQKFVFSEYFLVSNNFILFALPM